MSVLGKIIVTGQRITYRFVRNLLVIAAILLGVVPGCVGSSQPFACSRRPSRCGMQHIPGQSAARSQMARMCNRSPESCATAAANTPKEISAR